MSFGVNINSSLSNMIAQVERLGDSRFHTEGSRNSQVSYGSFLSIRPLAKRVAVGHKTPNFPYCETRPLDIYLNREVDRYARGY